MKLWPRSLAGQLLALGLSTMLAAHVLGIALMSWWQANHTSIHPLSARTTEARIFSAYRAVQHTADVPQLLADISLPEARFSLAAQPALSHTMDASEHAMAQRLRQQLKLADEAPVHVRLRPIKALQSERPRLEVQAELPLADGQWLHSRSLSITMPPHWSRVLSFSVMVGLLPTLVIALVFGRRIMRPLRELTEASKRVSRGESVRLEPAGPSGIREITQAFNDMQDSLIRFVKGRTHMVAAIGHDLRTPLTSLRIRAELIDDDELRRHMAQTIDEMSVMAEETLQFARDDAFQEPLQDVQLEPWLLQVMDEQRLLGRQIVWRGSLEAGMLYRCRPVHLKRALSNLLDNAACHGVVRVGATHDASRGLLRIEVDDDGPGIDPTQLERVFEPFARLDEARSQGGTGLGLAIARSSVRAHGGDVHLLNRSEGGLRAVIELPA